MGLFDFMANPDVNAPTNYPAMEARRKIALQMMYANARQPYPKTVGEGLSAVGNALATRGIMNELAQREEAYQRQTGQLAAPPPGAASSAATAPPPKQTSDASDSIDDEAPVRVASSADLPPGVANANASMDPRDAVTAAYLQQTAQAVPPVNPTLPGPTEAPVMPAGGQSPSVIPDIVKAPVVAENTIRPMPAMPPPGQMPPAVPTPETPPVPYQQPPSAGRVPPGPGAGQLQTLPEPPPVPPKSADQLYYEQQYSKALALGDPMVAATLKDKIDRLEQARQETYKPLLERWNAQKEVAQQNMRDAEKRRLEEPQTNLNLQKMERENQQGIENDKLRARLGNVEPADFVAALKTSQGAVANAGATADAIQRARQLSNNMFTGTWADFDTYLAKLKASGGFPADPRAANTEQFKNAMTQLMAQARPAIVGAGSQSEAELRLLQQATAADAKLTPETIRAALDAAERLNMKLAINHQALVRQYAGDEDPNRQATVYTVYGTRDMPSVVPQTYVDRLFANSQNPQALKDFDNAFHTPGLAEQVLRYRRPGK